MFTPEDTDLLERAAKQFKAARNRLEATLAENSKLKEENKALRSRNGAQRAALERAAVDVKILRARLNAPDALDAELHKARAEVWERRARVLKLANASFAAPRLLRRGKGDH